jgi:hypothetical protein
LIQPQYSLYLSSSSHQGFVHGKAVFANGEWHFMMLLAELPNNEVIDLGPLVVRPPVPSPAAKPAGASTAVKL